MSRIPPQQPELEDLQFLAGELKKNINSPVLAQILAIYGFPTQAVDKIRDKLAQYQISVVLLRNTIKFAIWAWEDEWVRHYLVSIEDDLINDTLDYYTYLQLSQFPNIVKKLEKHYYFDITGDVNQFIETFHRCCYTRRCLAYPDRFALQYSLKKATEHGHRDVIDQIISMRPDVGDLNPAANTAAGSGDLDLLKLFLAHGANSFHPMMQGAIQGRHQEIIVFLLSLTEQPASPSIQFDLDEVLKEAAGFGNVDAVNIMLARGAADIKSAIEYAATSGHANVIDVLLSAAPNQHNLQELIGDAATLAVTYNHLDVVKLLQDRGCRNFNDATRVAAGYGYRDTVEYLLDQGVTNINEILIHGVRRWYVVELLLERQQVNVEQVIRVAIDEDCSDTIIRMIITGLVSLDDVMAIAQAENNIRLIDNLRLNLK